PLQQAITHPHKRLQHLAGRYLLKYLFPDFPHEEILIADTRKPYLPYEQYHFSISHCGNYAAAIASSAQRVGIDIEMPKEKLQRISHKFLNDNEKHFINTASQSTNQLINQLTIAWAAKETVFKWWGWGNVDFSDHILLHHFHVSDTGSIAATFIREQETFHLPLQYKVFEELCLVWTATELMP
ncbi:MAG TPA: 4'-phosphopantetheinyl transferase superfamily protein, partial [Chitinophagaceae bacterium]|nr:4'-phosphopantetheinyl transferase superfamily protein [Chitinophagaceae bacterium]